MFANGWTETDGRAGVCEAQAGTGPCVPATLPPSILTCTRSGAFVTLSPTPLSTLLHPGLFIFLNSAHLSPSPKSFLESLGKAHALFLTLLQWKSALFTHVWLVTCPGAGCVSDVCLRVQLQATCGQGPSVLAHLLSPEHSRM